MIDVNSKSIPMLLEESLSLMPMPMLLEDPLSLKASPMDLDTDKRQAGDTLVSYPMGLDTIKSRGPVPKDRVSTRRLGRGHVEARSFNPKTCRGHVEARSFKPKGLNSAEAGITVNYWA